MRIVLVRDFSDISFGLQAALLERGLKERGIEVLSMDKNRTRKEDMPKDYDAYVYYTVYNTQLFWKGIPRYGKNVVFEVSDTDSLSYIVLDWFRQQPVDVIVTPSTFSAQGFFTLKMPPPQPIHVIPHAYDPIIDEVEEDDRIPHPCVLVLCPHSWERKGCDIAVQVIRKAMSAGYHFHHVITIGNMLDNRVRGLNVRGRIPDKREYYRLFKSCDILLYPVRGGAFEIPILEALVMGLDVIATEQGAWMDFIQDSYLVRVTAKKKYWFTNPFHVGYFFEPDLSDTYQKFVEALANWSPERKEERRKSVAARYKECFNYKAVADMWVDLLKS